MALSHQREMRVPESVACVGELVIKRCLEPIGGCSFILLRTGRNVKARDQKSRERGNEGTGNRKGRD
jgi:hypothetical protein